MAETIYTRTSTTVAPQRTPAAVAVLLAVGAASPPAYAIYDVRPAQRCSDAFENAFDSNALSEIAGLAAAKIAFRHRHAVLSKLPPGWDGRNSVPPSRLARVDALRLGIRVIDLLYPHISLIDLAAAGDGSMQLAVLTDSPRRLEMWVGDEAEQIGYLAVEGEFSREGSTNIDHCEALVEWLRTGRHSALV